MDDCTKYPIPAVRALIADERGRVLLLRRANTSFGQGAWCLPGGKVDFGKTVTQALADELAEELGVRLTACEFSWYQDSLPPAPGDPHYLNLYFHCHIEGEMRLNEESSAYAWVGPRDIAGYAIVFRNEEAITRFFTANMQAQPLPEAANHEKR